MRQNGGFTLIEILAVIVILALLVLIAGTSISHVVTKSKEELLQDQIKGLADTAITYVTDKGYYLKSCSASFNPSSPTEVDKNCYKKIKVSSLIQGGFFENKNDLCNPGKEVIVYRKNYGNFTELESYVSNDVCKY